MPRTTLSRPSRGADVEHLQHLLNRGGALLKVDGDFGSGTERAVKEAQKLAGLPATGVADAALWTWLEARPEPSPDIPTEAVSLLVAEEVGSRKFYDSHATFPHFPGGESGVTIGLGYDLRFQSAADFERDWGDSLTPAQMDDLRPSLGRPGSKAAVAALRHIAIPFPAAWRVFVRRLLPRYVAMTRKAFPGFDALPPLARGALVSLVYNRGAGMDGARKKEMRAIRDHMAAAKERLDRVAAEFEAMGRLWPDAPGLVARRKKEAALWRKGLGG
ncbi:MAG: hypothetical protein HKM95_08850 [Inquilinus sp.]|nr:hypothetical protein [Inquilinus sp.]